MLQTITKAINNLRTPTRYWLLAIGYCLLLFSPAAASNELDLAKEKFKKVNETFASVNSLYMQVTYNMFTNYKAEQPKYSYKGYYKKQQENYHSNLLGIETIQNKEYRIVVDSNDKIIALTNPTVVNQASSIDLDKILAMCSNITHSEKNNEQTFILSFNETSNVEFSAVHITVSKENYLKKIILYYKNEVPINEEDEENSPKDKPKIEIVYSDFKTKFHVSNDEFSEKKYFYLKNGKPVATQSFAQYQLLNQKVIKQ